VIWLWGEPDTTSLVRGSRKAEKDYHPRADRRSDGNAWYGYHHVL